LNRKHLQPRAVASRCR